MLHRRDPFRLVVAYREAYHLVAVIDLIQPQIVIEDFSSF